MHLVLLHIVGPLPARSDLNFLKLLHYVGGLLAFEVSRDFNYQSATRWYDIKIAFDF